MNKETKALMRELRRKGATLTRRNDSAVNVDGPNGRYILHLTPSAGMRMDLTRKELRKIGLDV